MKGGECAKEMKYSTHIYKKSRILGFSSFHQIDIENQNWQVCHCIGQPFILFSIECISALVFAVT